MHIPAQIGSKAVEVAGGSTVNGTSVQQNAGSGNIDSQQFAISHPGADSTWQIALKTATNKCIGPVGIGTGNGTSIEVQDCNGGSNQAWSIQAGANSGGFTFINVASARCLEVPIQVLVDGTPLDLYRLQRRPQPDVQGGCGVLRARCGRTVSG